TEKEVIITSGCWEGGSCGRLTCLRVSAPLLRVLRVFRRNLTSIALFSSDRTNPIEFDFVRIAISQQDERTRSHAKISGRAHRYMPFMSSSGNHLFTWPCSPRSPQCSVSPPVRSLAPQNNGVPDGRLFP